MPLPGFDREVIMKIRQLAEHWEQNAAGLLSPTGHVLHLDMEAEARLAALIDMYPKRSPEELLGDANMANSLVDRYAEVTVDEVVMAAKKIFRPENCSTLHYIAKN